MTNDSPARSLSLALPFFSLSLLAVLLLSLSDGLISCYVCWSFLLSLSFARRSLAGSFFFSGMDRGSERSRRKEGRKEVRSGERLLKIYLPFLRPMEEQSKRTALQELQRRGQTELWQEIQCNVGRSFDLSGPLRWCLPVATIPFLPSRDAGAGCLPPPNTWSRSRTVRTGSSSQLRTMLPESSSRPLPA